MRNSVLFYCGMLLVFCLAITSCGRRVGESGARLVYWSMWNEAEPQGQVMARAAESFTKETGIRMDINFMGRDIRMILQPALDSGEHIDVFDEDLRRVNVTWGNYILPLDPYINQIYPATDGEPFHRVISRPLLDLARELGSGSVMTIPYQPFVFAVMYNKDLFDQAGINSLPKTWDEMLDASARLRNIGVAGITVDDAYTAFLFGQTMTRIAGMDAALAMSANDDFSGPHILRFGEIWEHMARNGFISPSTAGNVWPSGQVNDIAGGKAAMYLNGTWLPNELRGVAPNMRWGSFAFPAIDPAGDGIETNSYGAQAFGIHKNSRNPEEAFRWIVWMTTGEWDTTLARETIGIPISNNAVWPDALAEARTVVDSSTQWLPWAAGFEDTPEMNAKVIENFQRLVRGDYNAQQFAEAMRR